MPKIAPDTQIETITALPLSEEEEAIKQRDESVAALREFFKELFRYLFTLFCFTLVIFLDSNWSQKHSDTPPSHCRFFCDTSLFHSPNADSAQLFARTIFDPENAPGDVNAFWDFLYSADDADSCSGVFCTLSKLDYFSQELLNGQNGTQNAFLYYGNRLLGQVSAPRPAPSFCSVRPTFLTRLLPKVRLRQVRVQHKDCSRFWNQFDAASTKCEPVLCHSCANRHGFCCFNAAFSAIIMTFPSH
jgi:hypothetical protein